MVTELDYVMPFRILVIANVFDSIRLEQLLVGDYGYLREFNYKECLQMSPLFHLPVSHSL